MVENLYFGKIWKSCFAKVLVWKRLFCCFAWPGSCFLRYPLSRILVWRKRLFCLFGNGYINIGILDPANIWKTCLRRVLIWNKTFFLRNKTTDRKPGWFSFRNVQVRIKGEAKKLIEIQGITDCWFLKRIYQYWWLIISPENRGAQWMLKVE